MRERIPGDGGPAVNRAPLWDVLFQGALLAHPRALRRRYSGEMLETFRSMYAQRRRMGMGAAAAYALRAVADVVRSGARARRSMKNGGPQGNGNGPSRGGGGMVMSEWWTDVRVALRALRKTPGFTAAAVAVLALGIGANAAVFSALKATLLTPPPYPQAERLVLIDLTEASKVRPGPFRAIAWSYPKYQAMREMKNLPFQASAVYAVRSLTLTGVGDAAYLSTEVVTPEYMKVLGVAPSLGRDFTAGDDVDGSGMVVILGHSLWQDRFGADPGAVGRTVTLNDRPVTIVGVMPAGFRGLSGRGRLFVPVHTGAGLTDPSLVQGATAHWLAGVARLAPGVTVAQADERMHEVGKAVEAMYPMSDPTSERSGGARAFLTERINDQARRSVLILSVAAALLLLVACANLAGLMVARASRRSREAAVRVALGAGRWRVARGFLAEALVLAVGGGAVAVLVARVGARTLAAAWPQRFLSGTWNVQGMDLSTVAVDSRVLLFTGAMAVLAGLLLGMFPALAVSQVNPAGQLRAAGVGEGRRRRLDLRRTLVPVEIALALVLMVGAGLLVRSMAELQSVKRGFRPGNLLTLSYDIPRGSRWYSERAVFDQRFIERLEALPGVESAAGTCVVPVSGGHCVITWVRGAGGQTSAEGSRPRIGVNYISDQYFSTLGIPVLEGRTFASEDQSGTRPVVVLSEGAAKRLFPDGDALGRPITIGTYMTPEAGPGLQATGGDGATAEVIGVVGDVLYDRPENGVMLEAYISERQGEGYGTVIARTRGEPLAVVPAVRAAMAELDPDVPIYGVSTVADEEVRATADTRVLGGLLGTFALLALVLACTGVWAVVAYAVASRIPELGLRVALGAEPRQVVGLVVRGGLGLAVVGVVMGAAAAWGASRVLASLLYGVRPSDPATFVSASLILLAVAALAAWLPARRATRVDPTEALRAE